MITPYGASRENEFAIFERIMQILHAKAALNGPYLLGTLADNGNTNIRIEPIHLSMDEINKLWSIFPNKPYRLSLYYQLTSVRILSAEIPESATAVIDKTVEMYHKD